MTSMRIDPFRELDRLAAEVMGASRAPRLMPMDAYRSGDSYVLRFDLPGVDPASLDVVAEKNTLTVRARRGSDGPEGAEYLVSERPAGTYGRQIVLGDGLDVDAIDADYHDGVLTVTIPVSAKAKPRRVEIARRGETKAIDAESTSEVTAG